MQVKKIKVLWRFLWKLWDDQLLTLLLIVLVSVVSAANSVEAAPLQLATGDLFHSHFNKDISELLDSLKTGETTQIRRHFLYNMCSEKFVRIKKKGRTGINAKGKISAKHMDFMKLIFESLPSGAIKIFGEHTDLHICFDKRGRLRARKHGTDPGCEFKEEYTENRSYTLYRSAHKPNWYLGFKKNGRPLKVTAIHKKSKEGCFKFQKLSSLPTQSRTENKRKKCKRKNGPPGIDFCQFLRKQQNSIKTSGRKIRHSKSHPERRKG